METLLDLVMARIERSLATLRYSVSDILPVYFSVDFQQKKHVCALYREEQTSKSPPAQAWPRPFRFPNSRFMIEHLIKVFLLAMFDFNVRHILCRRGTRHTLDDLPKEGSGGCSC